MTTEYLLEFSQNSSPKYSYFSWFQTHFISEKSEILKQKNAALFFECLLKLSPHQRVSNLQTNQKLLTTLPLKFYGNFVAKYKDLSKKFLSHQKEQKHEELTKIQNNSEINLLINKFITQFERYFFLILLFL